MNSKQVNYLCYIILSFTALTFLLPLVWLVAALLDPSASDALKTPTAWTMGNFASVSTEKSNLWAYWVSFVISFVESLAVVLLSCLAAYPLSRYKLSYRKALMNIILFIAALPMIAVIVPVYKICLNPGLLDKIWGVILCLSASSPPYGLWLMKNFMDAVLQELEEAAWVDGATTMKSITGVVLPLTFPGICTVFIYTFSKSWGNSFVPYILLSPASKTPVSVKLYQFLDQYGLIDYGPLITHSIIYMLPSILLYILPQNYMSKGFSLSGAAKGQSFRI